MVTHTEHRAKECYKVHNEQTGHALETALSINLVAVVVGGRGGLQVSGIGIEL
jgi:hypothetical protein